MISNSRNWLQEKVRNFSAEIFNSLGPTNKEIIAWKSTRFGADAQIKLGPRELWRIGRKLVTDEPVEFKTSQELPDSFRGICGIYSKSKKIWKNHNTSRKHGKKEPQSFSHCGSFDHHALQWLNICRFVFLTYQLTL